MKLFSTHPLPGIYQYSYPTFVDTPQQICVHFITPDQQKAFVSYPRHPNRKAAQLIDISWFKSVDLVKLDGQPQLMHFLEVILPNLLGNCPAKVIPLDSPATMRFKYGINELLVAFG
ncbi:hypothetical protein [Spirosoma endophyticum]|uniref:Uncharacterized protein n=1 Tax=Spirosoma endophyticum TaxID=662367 RepID=A0A1I1W9L9_9BACT|nr:hypothetical protein [Spirosoma endophyticum]SFD91896.1 hypothetical protein SAMN05216167_108193 [Spirosoma endophyticum]